jgi:sulfopyruvate decarboxylase subunit beta
MRRPPHAEALGRFVRRIDAIRKVVGSAWGAETLFVVNLGFPSREMYSVHDGGNVFYMLGSMGLASSVGLGLSIVRRDKQVIALDGDGSVLMNLGTLATIAEYAPPNYHLFIIDNGAYGSTGNQPTFTSGGTDLAALARAAGIGSVARVSTGTEVSRLLGGASLPTVLVIDCTRFNAEVPLVPLSPAVIRRRFMSSLGG